jgi:hypothetical protein
MRQAVSRRRFRAVIAGEGTIIVPAAPIVLVAGICIEAHLPPVTDRPEEYRRYRTLRTVPPPGTVDER